LTTAPPPAAQRRRIRVVLALAAAAIVLAAAAGAWLYLSGRAPRAVEAAALLYRLARDEVPPIVAQSVAWPSGGATYRGDLYGSRGGSRAALLLVPGAAETGKDDPRLVAFARDLADAGFLVLVPDLPGPKALQVSSADIGETADAGLYLASLVGDGEPLGLAAISYGVGPTLLAALEPRLVKHVDFVLSLGGYYDATAVITFFTTGFWRPAPAAPWQPGRPNAYGKWVFVLANAARLDDFRDRERLAVIARLKLANLGADVAAFESELGPEGRAVMALLDNRDPERVPALIAELPPRIRAEIAALDLSTKDLSPLRAQVLLVHGRDDAIVPYSESVALAHALGPGRAHLYLLDHLSHASWAIDDLADGFRLWRAADELLALRDRR